MEAGDVTGGGDDDSPSACTDEAIFLNFLCMYLPSLSSHLCSTGSTAGVTGAAGGSSSLARLRLEDEASEVHVGVLNDDRDSGRSSGGGLRGEARLDWPPKK